MMRVCFSISLICRGCWTVHLTLILIVHLFLHFTHGIYFTSFYSWNLHVLSWLSNLTSCLCNNNHICDTWNIRPIIYPLTLTCKILNDCCHIFFSFLWELEVHFSSLSISLWGKKLLLDKLVNLALPCPVDSIFAHELAKNFAIH